MANSVVQRTRSSAPLKTTLDAKDVMTVTSMDNVGMVVEDIGAAIAFFEGDWGDGVTGLRHMRVQIAL